MSKDETDKFVQHVYEDVYVSRKRADTRSVRCVEKDGEIELIGSDEAALDRTYNRLASGEFSVRATKLRPVEDEELLKLLSPDDLEVTRRLLGTGKRRSRRQRGG
jgi:hypothetical protein